MSENALPFCEALTAYLGNRLGVEVRVLDDAGYPELERRLYAAEAELGVVCGLQYVYGLEAGAVPGVDLVAAAVMSGPRYGCLPIYFSDVVVRADSAARSFEDLRGGRWADNEPTSHSGYALTRYALSAVGVRAEEFFGATLLSGSHLRSLELLLDGAIDATAIDSTVLEQELRVRPSLAAEIRVIDTFGPSPVPPVVVSRAVPVSVRAELTSALLQMHEDPRGRSVLTTGAMDRFLPVADSDYEPIRMMARVAGLLGVAVA